MIIYEANVKDFINKSKNPTILATLIEKNLLDKFGIKVAQNEKKSWTKSLPNISKLLKQSKNDLRKVLCEFNIPTSKKRVDFIILGKDKYKKPSAWILELKQWSNVTEEAWNEFRVSGKYLDSHPSDQAHDYEYRLKHEMGLDEEINIKSSAYLHNLDNDKSPLFNEKYKEILNLAWLYSKKDKENLAKEIDEHTIIRDGNESFTYFKEAKWKPSKTFKQYIQEDMKSMRLVGSQKRIFEKIINFLQQKPKENKMTFIISGDPGSGKTIVAFKIAMALMYKLEYKIQLMIPGQEVRAAFEKEWKDKKLVSILSGAKLRKGFDAAIIDEAHKAVARDYGVKNYKYNYKNMNMAIIFIDNDQVINKKGVSKEDIKEIAYSFGHTVHEYNIEENFRNSGERNLLDWIDYVFYKRLTYNGEFKYEQKFFINENSEYKLQIYNSDDEFVNSYKEKFKDKSETTRIVSTWHSGYYKGFADENGDLKRTVKIGNYNFAWNPNEEWWKKLDVQVKKTYNNFVKKFVEDRSSFLTETPKREYVAYFNHLQGYEFDNIFVYIPNVFTYENNEIIFHRDRLAKEVKSSQTWAQKATSNFLGDKNPYEENKKYFLNRIKVMLTRGTKSTHVFAEDKALNDYIKKHVK